MPAAFLGRLSQDFFGQLLKERLPAEGVHPTCLSKEPERTALAFVHVTAHEEPEYSFYVENTAERMLRVKDLPTGFPHEVSSIHSGFLNEGSFPDSVQDEGGAGDVADAAGAEGDVLQAAPASLEFDGGPLAACSDVPHQHVEHAVVDVKCLPGRPLGRRCRTRMPMPARM